MWAEVRSAGLKRHPTSLLVRADAAGFDDDEQEEPGAERSERYGSNHLAEATGSMTYSQVRGT